MSREREPGSPEAVHPASTVVLVRQHGEELQVYLLRRSLQSGFFPGNYVFPGGAVSSQDRDPDFWGAHSDLPAAELSKRFSGEEVLFHYVSAVRETFEEAGVFLGRSGQPATGWLNEARSRRIPDGLPKGWLRNGALNGGCAIGVSLLAPWSHWITPEGMPRRFDTRFFVAFMPRGETCSPDGKETDHGVWVRPEDALAGNLGGEIPLSPPTLVTLHQLLPFRQANELEAALRDRTWGAPFVPRLVRLSRGAMIVEPWDPLFHREFTVNADRLESALLPVGEPFSRLWFYKGLWRPVGLEVEMEECASNEG